VKVIAFDLDDTLVRWQGPVREAVTRTLVAEGRERDEATFAAVVAQTWQREGRALWTGRIGVAEMTHAAAGAVGAALRLDRAEASRLYDAYIAQVAALIVPYDDTRVLPELRTRFRLGVTTNGAGEVQRAKLARTGLAGLFDFVVISAEVGVAKPDVAFYEIVCRTAGAAAADIAVVGDNVERDLEPAATAGLRAIWLHRPDAGGSAAGWEGPTITSLYELVNVLESLPSTA